jgi:quinol monooxygenase YgiN
MYAVIRHYHFDPKDSKEIAEKLSNDFVPIMKKAKGFIRYYWLDNGKGEGASFSLFNGRHEADDSVLLAEDWVHENFTQTQIMKQKPEIMEGTIKTHD